MVMARHLLLCASFVLLTPAHSFSQPIKPGSLQYRYGSVAFGWYYQQKCRRLTGAETQELRWHTAQATVALARRGVPRQRLLAIQQSGRRVASKAHCSARARSTLLQALAIARKLSFDLTGRRYTVNSTANLHLSKFALIAGGLDIASRCRYWAPPGQRSTLLPKVRRVWNRLFEQMLQRYGSRRANIASNAGRNRSRRIPCGPTAKREYLGALRLLRQMQAELKIPD